MTLVSTQSNLPQLVSQLEARKRQISYWLDQRKVEYSSDEIGQFRGYSTEILERIQIDLRVLAREKMEELAKEREARLNSVKYPSAKLVLMGAAQGGSCLGSGGYCGAIALNASASLAVLSAGLACAVSIYFLGKLCIRTLDESRPSVIRSKVAAEARRDRECLIRSCDKLNLEIEQLKSKSLVAERREDIAALQDTNGNTRRVQRWAQQRELRNLRQKLGVAQRETQRLDRVRGGVELQLKRSDEIMNLKCRDLQGEIADQKQITDRLKSYVAQLRRDNRANAGGLAKIQSENAANLESAGTSARAAQRAEAAAEELRSTHAEALARIERVHRENFAMLLRSLESNSSENSVQKLYRKGQNRRGSQSVAPPFTPQISESALPGEIAQNWEDISQHSDRAEGSSDSHSEGLDPQNCAANLRMEMSDQLSRDVEFLN